MPNRAPTNAELYRTKVSDHRASSAARGYGRQHRNWRLKVLRRFPACVMCGAPSTQADHIIPVSKGGDWSLENGQGLCAACHGKKTRRQ